MPSHEVGSQRSLFKRKLILLFKMEPRKRAQSEIPPHHHPQYSLHPPVFYDHRSVSQIFSKTLPEEARLRSRLTVECRQAEDLPSHNYLRSGLPTVSNLTTSSPISLPPVERPVPTIAPGNDEPPSPSHAFVSHLVSTPATLESLTNELHDQTDHVVPPEEVSSEQKPMLSRRRKSVKNRHGSSSSVTHQHEQSAPGDRPTSAKRSHTPLKSPARKSSSSNPKTISSNRKSTP